MKRDYMPRYMRIKNDILQRLSKGELKRGDKLPTEYELARRFSVARITVVTALRELENDGVIVKRRGSGSFIADDCVNEDDEDIFSQITPSPQRTITHGVIAAKPNYEYILRTLAGVFRVENPDVRVDIVNLPWPDDDRSDPYLLLIGRGEVPTVGEFFMHAAYAAIDALVPLDGFDDYPQLINTLVSGSVYLTTDSSHCSRVHALATRYNTRMIIANIDFLTAAGVSDLDIAPNRKRLLEWINQAKIYANKLNNGSHNCFLMPPRGWHGVIGLVQFLSQALSNDEYNPNDPACFRELFHRPECLEELRFLTQIMQDAAPIPENGQDLFAVGRVGLIVSGNMWPITLSEMMSSPVSTRVYPLPAAVGQERFYPVRGNWSLGIFRAGIRDEGELEAAWRWVKFLFRRRSQYLLSTDYTFPTLQGIHSLLERKYPALHAAFLAEAAHSRPQFDFRNIRDALTLVGGELNKAFAGVSTPEQCLQAIQDKMHILYESQ